MTTPSDDQQLDRMLQDLHDGLQCNTQQRDRMRQRFLESLSEDVLPENVLPDDSLPTESSSTDMIPQVDRGGRWLPLMVVLSLAAAILAAVFLIPWQNDSDTSTAMHSTDPSTSSTIDTPSVDSLAFTSGDLQRSAILTCEVQRLFETQVQLIHRHDERIDFDFADDSTMRSTSAAPTTASTRLIIRFVLQHRNDDLAWQTVQTHEVIGSNDQQFSFSHADGLSLRYWSHLLPDDTLWTEVAVSPTSQSTAETASLHCRPNQPKLAWTRTINGQAWRLLIVHELLGTCDGEVI
ncbi:hypothetical protein [Stieleria varia]|uniref:Uncharacterized protein n=1 Tax=Stieleria varia TaxID=2528005 RepID=A0A5C6A314_9BACT|nr:hypothetical protein [Stieleria varia]TWT92793.1 hypothetical protein Pla52n_61580 [Stieleria varia]